MPSIGFLIEIHQKNKDFYYRGTPQGQLDDEIRNFLKEYYPECLI